MLTINHTMINQLFADQIVHHIVLLNHKIGHMSPFSSNNSRNHNNLPFKNNNTNITHSISSQSASIASYC
jgi:hypothetical protein